MIKSDDLAKEILATLTAYTDEVEEGIEEAKKKVAQDTVKLLKSTSPVRKKGPSRGYAKSWTAKRQPDGGYVVHNAKHYQITHLLEKGHAKVGGGRVAAIPHIAPAEKQGIEQYIKSVERVIKNG